MNGTTNAVARRALGSSIVRVERRLGIAQANPESMGTKLLPLSPHQLNRRSMMNAARAM